MANMHAVAKKADDYIAAFVKSGKEGKKVQAKLSLHSLRKAAERAGSEVEVRTMSGGIFLLNTRLINEQ